MSRPSLPSTRILPTVVLAGRPNVGKSSLNEPHRGRRAAWVEEEPGVTRDRNVLEAEWTGRRLQSGRHRWVARPGGHPRRKISEQAEKAVADAMSSCWSSTSLIGVTDEDLEAAKVIRRFGVPVRLVVNKVDDTNRDASIWDFIALGVGDPWRSAPCTDVALEISSMRS